MVFPHKFAEFRALAGCNLFWLLSARSLVTSLEMSSVVIHFLSYINRSKLFNLVELQFNYKVGILIRRL